MDDDRYTYSEDCSKCGLTVSGVSFKSQEEAEQRFGNNINLHVSGKRCRARRQSYTN